MGGIAADYVMGSGRYSICIVSEEPHWLGRAGQIIAGDFDDLVTAESVLNSLNSDSLKAVGNGKTGPLGDCVIGIHDGARHRWV